MGKKKSPAFSCSSIKTDAKMNFYTSIITIAAFNAIFNFWGLTQQKYDYWKGPQKTFKLNNSKIKNIQNRFSQCKLSQKDEFLLTMMKLRLSLLNEDLATRFNVSTTHCSNIFKTRIRLLSTIGNTLINWLPKECILQHMPNAFKEKGYSKLWYIIDCTEVFVERSKSLEVKDCC